MTILGKYAAHIMYLLETRNEEPVWFGIVIRIVGIHSAVKPDVAFGVEPFLIASAHNTRDFRPVPVCVAGAHMIFYEVRKQVHTLERISSVVARN